MQKKDKNTLSSLLNEITPLEQSKTDAKMIIAARIADAIQLKNWKSNDLLKAIGKKSPSLITKWLSGTHNFTIDTLIELEEALNISLLNLEDVKEEVVVNYHVVVKSNVELSNNPEYLNMNNLENRNARFYKSSPMFYSSKIGQS